MVDYVAKSFSICTSHGRDAHGTVFDDLSIYVIIPKENLRIIIAAEDLLPLETSGLEWRFTDDQTNLLPSEALQQIHPLPIDIIYMIRDKVYFPDSRNQNPHWQVDGSFDASAVRDSVEQWLHSQVTDNSTRVIVFWWSNDAVLTTWDIFCRYWDNFCYPSSDDVAILPLDEQWEIAYHHEEVFTVLHRIHSDLQDA